MSDISSWDATAANNNDSPPDGFPEGQAPSTLNNAAREVMASVRRKWEDAEWFDDGKTKTFVAATQFRISSEDVTAAYHLDRRVRAVGSTTGTIYGTITSSSFSVNTTVTVTWDSGSLQNEALTISYGILSGPANNQAYQPFPAGTKMLFQQTSAPVGWTKDTTHDDKALRVVTGTASSGGNDAFTTVFGSSISTASYTLQEADIPAHTHTNSAHSHGAGSLVVVGGSGTGGGPNVATGGSVGTNVSVSGTTASGGGSATGSVGGDGGHSHDMTMDLQYVDVIVATKD